MEYPAEHFLPFEWAEGIDVLLLKNYYALINAAAKQKNIYKPFKPLGKFRKRA